MSRDVAKAEFNTSDKPATKHSWAASNTEISDTKRASRSSKPEVLYHISPTQTSRAKRTQTETSEPRIYNLRHKLPRLDNRIPRLANSLRLVNSLPLGNLTRNQPIVTPHLCRLHQRQTAQ